MRRFQSAMVRFGRSSFSNLLLPVAALALLSSSTSDAARTGSFPRRACQTFIGSPNLVKCPPGTVYVSATDHAAKFNTIQAAVDSGASTILIGNGSYHEKVTVSNATAVTLLGQTSGATRSSSGSRANLVRVIRNSAVPHGSYENRASAVLYAHDSPNFKAYNINFHQVHGPGAVALALGVERSQASFYGCEFDGFQDTVLVGNDANVFIKDSQISGTVDYIYGTGTLWIEASTLVNRGQGVIAAWAGIPGTMTGAYISRSKIRASPIKHVPSGSVSLGRPWNSLARTVYLSCEMDLSISPARFSIWTNADPRLSASLYFAEYGSSGPGSAPSSRKLVGDSTSIDKNHLGHELSSDQASQWTLTNVFKAVGTSWIDFSY